MLRLCLCGWRWRTFSRFAVAGCGSFGISFPIIRELNAFDNAHTHARARSLRSAAALSRPQPERFRMRNRNRDKDTKLNDLFHTSLLLCQRANELFAPEPIPHSIRRRPSRRSPRKTIIDVGKRYTCVSGNFEILLISILNRKHFSRPPRHPEWNQIHFMGHY